MIAFTPHLVILTLGLLPSSLGNLVYLSPTTTHPELGIPAPQLLLKRDGTPASKFHNRRIRFTHGVASGDPYADSAIIWTRALPKGVKDWAHKYTETDRTDPVCVRWEVSTSEMEFSEGNIVSEGETSTSGRVDFTVKVEATGLESYRYYWYRFTGCDRRKGKDISPVGRFKTLPKEDDEEVESAAIAVVSCSNYAEGLFKGYSNIAKRDAVDWIVHLGDYIYETHKPFRTLTRMPKPWKEVVTQQDYRRRYAQYRSDRDLQFAHQKMAFINVWDDHEVANNGWRDGSSSMIWQVLEGLTWQERRQGALRAFFEWMPVRQVEPVDEFRIWRSFKIGKLAELVMLDTRYYDRDATDRPDLQLQDERSIMGKKQEKWLENTLLDAQNRNATWKLIGNQVQFSPFNETANGGNGNEPFYWDGWAGYLSNRKRLLDAIVDHGISNTVMLTGDYHALWTADLTHPSVPYNASTGFGSIGVEFAGPGITSWNGYGKESEDREESDKVSAALLRDNPTMKWAEGHFRGYFEVTFGKEELRTRYWSIADVWDKGAGEFESGVWVVREGEGRLGRPFGDVKAGVVGNG
ncbi:hypothetical protein BJ508DRAFT_418309 [Ascobolus immersus RN42]|uniref:Alkaline phosphatase n=1 Tax=Ascobolus immersus RN42 TaxID=1160509 RepID=A0A3N4HMM2_ASCIM|nr:hypothetical protein BJ508DRAFT_418309 [Ascobolus immersus RN42]